MFNDTKYRPYYLLKIYTSDEELRDKYEQQAENFNKQISKYLAGDSIMTDSGFDIFCPEREIIKGGNINKEDYKCSKIGQKIKCSMIFINTAFNLERHVGYYIYSRSSTASKTPLRLSNCVGIIDPGYRGEIATVFDNLDKNDYTVAKYQRLVQICPPDLTYPLAIQVVNNLDNLGSSQRGDGGFGSTGI